MPRTRFVPCIDIHAGKVKQIVGGTLDTPSLRTNFTSEKPAEYYAELYRYYKLTGAHVIMLGPGCETAALQAIQAWPNSLQIAGGINLGNAQRWIDRGASKVIVTSYLFPDARFSMQRLEDIENIVGKERLVVDISCRRRDEKWLVAMNRWQTITDMEVTQESIRLLEEHCSEFLIHAADVEGLCQGIDEELVERLGEWVSIPTTYAGGGKSIEDLELVNRLSKGKVDLTIGSALDLFGGTGVKFMDCIEWNRRHNDPASGNPSRMELRTE